jgi:hypothetical protein
MQFFPELSRQNHSNIYNICLFALCLNSFIFTTETVEAKGRSRAHPVKKVDVTPNTRNEDVWTFTLESNTYQSTVYLNPILDFSSRNGWDIQIASYNIPVHGGGAQNFEWDSYINLSKTFDISTQFKAIAGTQNGTTAFTASRQYHNVDYGLLVYQPIPAVNFHAGSYWANKALTATTDYLGYTAGFSFEPIKSTLTVQGDYFSGSNNVSGAIVNVFYRFLPKVQVYIGVGVPETDSGNEFYGTLGFSLASKSF